MLFMFVAPARGCTEDGPRPRLLRRLFALAVVIGLTVCVARALLPGEETPEKPAPITEADARAFAEAISKSAADQDLETWNSLIDWNALLDTATVTAEPDSPQLTEAKRLFTSSFVQTFRSSGGWLPEIGRAVANGGSYKCVRIVVDVPEPYVLFRTIFNPGGVTYQRYFAARNPSGTVVAKDLYAVTSGERFSESLHRTWMMVIAQAKDRVSGRPSGLSHSGREMTAFSDLVVQNKSDEVIERYHQLSAELQRDKNILMMRYKAAISVSGEEYHAAVTDIRNFYPDDPSLDMLLIDLYIDRENYAEAQACLGRLYRNTGGDAYIDVMRANVFCKQKQLKEARAAVERAIRAEPDLPDAYFAGIEVSLAERKFDEVARNLTKLEALGQQLQDLSEIPEYAPFVESPEYATWTQSREKRSQD